jgi:hypothetical protein
LTGACPDADGRRFDPINGMVAVRHRGNDALGRSRRKLSEDEFEATRTASDR